MSRNFLKSLDHEQRSAFRIFRQKKLAELQETSHLLRFGNKPIALPKFTIALVRTPRLSPFYARFLVPLNFTKYDIRDYLFHAYDIRCSNIRSFIKYSPMRDSQEAPRRMFREEDRKYMTVEMDKPFVWPDDPEDWSPWGKEEDLEDEKPKGEEEDGQKEIPGLNNKGIMRWTESDIAKERRERAEGLREHAERILQGGRELWEKERSETYGKWDKKYKIKI